MSQSLFTPSKLVDFDHRAQDDLILETTADVAQDVFENLADLEQLPRLHDVGCARGNVSQRFLALQPSDYGSHSNNIRVTATDKDPVRIQALQRLADEERWPLTATAIPVEKISFPKDSFDISFANYVLFYTANEGVDGLRRMKESTRSGGVVAFTTWHSQPHFELIKNIHQQVFGNEEPRRHLIQQPDRWFQEAFWTDMAIKVGFSASNIEVRRTTVTGIYQDSRRLAALLWSWGARTREGWNEKDEVLWDSCLDLLVEAFSNSKGFEVKADGSVSLALPAIAIIARV